MRGLVDTLFEPDAAVNAGYERLGTPSVTLNEIRQLSSYRQPSTPGHPEYGDTPGVEVTTGPLGQGMGNSVGMAIAQKWLASRYNKPEFDIFDYDIYAVCGDGCMMEGVGSEAASLAGHLALDNPADLRQQLHHHRKGNTRFAFSDDVAARFMGYWSERAGG